MYRARDATRRVQLGSRKSALGAASLVALPRRATDPGQRARRGLPQAVPLWADMARVLIYIKAYKGCCAEVDRRDKHGTVRALSWVFMTGVLHTLFQLL